MTVSVGDHSFTTLESLLLFQSVATNGTAAESFARISESLRNSELLKRSSDANQDRLSPQALTELYLRLLKAEAKRSLQNAEESADQAGAGGSKPSSKKSKVGSPKLATVDDAITHRHLEPQMINRLYDKYKDQMIHEIREDERRYDRLVEQLKALEAHPLAQSAATPTLQDKPTPNESSPSQAPQDVQADNRVTDNETVEDLQVSKHLDAHRPDGLGLPGSKESLLRPSSADGKNSSITSQPSPEQGRRPSPRPSSNQVESRKSPLKQMKQPSPVPPGAKQLIPPSALDTPQPAVTQPSISAVNQPTVAAQPSPTVQLKPGAPYTGNLTAQSTSTQPVPVPPSQSHVQPHPAATPAGGQVVQNQASHLQPGQAPSIPAPLHSQLGPGHHRSPSDQQHSHLKSSPNPEAWGQPQYNVPGQQPAPPHFPQNFNHPASHVSPHRGGGIILPPFQVTPQAPTQSQQSQASKPADSSHRPPAQARTSQGLQVVVPPSKGDQTSRPKPSPATGQRISSAPALSLAKPGVHYSPGSTTGWRLPPGTPPVALKPRPRSISPLSDREASPEQEVDASKMGTSRATRSGKAPAARDAGRNRGTRAHSKTPSVAASSSYARTRSQSVASHGDDASFVSKPDDSVKFKTDPNTPTPSAAAPAVKPRTTRSAATSTTQKRKRANTADTEAAETPITTPRPLSPSHRRSSSRQGQPQTVTAYRNFHKMAAPIMNNIGSHKHASLFSGPVPTKTAGYYDTIKRPTDLKTIRTAIGAGTKAVAAATAGSPPAGSAEASGTITLPFSSDLVPPKAIVNGAQLEQEITRMFANAVMFNEGNEDVVADAREMFGSLEESIANWRRTESGEGGEEMGGVEEGSTSVKRRRL